MRRLLYLFVLFVIMPLVSLTGCMPTQVIVVKFEDLSRDFMALEESLDSGAWAKFDWEKMEIIISSSKPDRGPVALGGFETPTSSDRTPVESKPDLDLKSIEETDTLVRIMRRRQDRYNAIKEIKSKGIVGESNRGTLGKPDGSPLLTLEKEQRDLVEGENTDRVMLFHEVLRQKKYGADKLDDVAEKFAEVQRAKAAKGYWIQLQDGAWTQVK